MRPFKKATYALYSVFLFWATLTIFLRRWAWDQVATQVPATLVYLTIVFNILVVIYCIGRILNRGPRKRRKAKVN